jgi:hypothetical protein
MLHKLDPCLQEDIFLTSRSATCDIHRAENFSATRSFCQDKRRPDFSSKRFSTCGEADGFTNWALRRRERGIVAMHDGRPNFRHIFHRMATLAHSIAEKRVAVLICGASGIINSCLEQAARGSEHGIRFECHYEAFSF